MKQSGLINAVDSSVATPSTYQERLQEEPRWALSEASQFFEGKSAVQATLRKVTARLDELGIPYAVSGGLALFAHGYRRFTEDVDLLVTSEGLKQVHNELDGLGYVPLFKGSKNLKDAETKVKIEFLVTGQFPGDGKQKPVAFPDPTTVAIEKDGIKYLSLRSLIELKLASGMTQPTRLKDFADVIELIKLLEIPEDISKELSPYVREKFLELWKSVQQTPRRFVMLWRNKFLTTEAKSLGEMVEILRQSSELLASMLADGVTLDPDGGTADDYAHLVTTDPAIAKKYDMHDENEFWGQDGDDDSDESNPKNTSASPD